jgi:hypothetical protein
MQGQQPDDTRKPGSTTGADSSPTSGGLRLVESEPAPPPEPPVAEGADDPVAHEIPLELEAADVVEAAAPVDEIPSEAAAAPAEPAAEDGQAAAAASEAPKPYVLPRASESTPPRPKPAAAAPPEPSSNRMKYLAGLGACGLIFGVSMMLGGPSPVELPKSNKPAAAPAAVEPLALPQRLTVEAQRGALESQISDAQGRGDAGAEAEALVALARLERSQGDAPRALERYGQAVERQRAAGALAAAAATAIARADLLRATGRLEPARAQYDAAVQLAAQIRDAKLATHGLRRLGDAQAALGQWDDAHATYSDGLAIAKQVKDADAELWLTLRVAAAEQALGRPEAARPLFETALKLSDSMSTPTQARVWLAFGDFEAALGRDAATFNAYEQAVTLAGATRDAYLETRAWQRRSAYERQRGQLAAARTHYELALRAARQREHARAEALTLMRLAEVELALRDVTAARQHYAEAKDCYARAKRPEGEARVTLALGDLEAAQKQPVAARTNYEQALTLAEHAGDVGTQIAALDRLHNLLSASEPDAAQDLAQRASALRGEALGAPSGGA